MIIAIWGVFPSWAQTWRVVQHPDHSKKAIVAQDKVISDYVYTEVSELSEGKAFVSQGSLYAYIDAQGNALTLYQFTVASNFKHGYALVGDSFSMSVLNDSMRLVIPLQYPRVKLPSSDLTPIAVFPAPVVLAELAFHPKLLHKPLLCHQSKMPSRYRKEENP